MGIYLGLGFECRRPRSATSVRSERPAAARISPCGRAPRSTGRSQGNLKISRGFSTRWSKCERCWSPKLLIQECLEIERMAGRVRDVPKGPRSLDIDILLYRDRIVDLPGLDDPSSAISGTALRSRAAGGIGSGSCRSRLWPDDGPTAGFLSGHGRGSSPGQPDYFRNSRIRSASRRLSLTDPTATKTVSSPARLPTISAQPASSIARDTVEAWPGPVFRTTMF